MNICNILLVGLLAAGALSACGKENEAINPNGGPAELAQAKEEQARSATTAGQTSAPTGVDVANPSLDEAFNLPLGVFRPIDTSELDSLEEGIYCSLDGINEATARNATIKVAAPARFSGFVQVQSQTTPAILILKGPAAQSFVTRVLLTTNRTDIAKDKGIQEAAYDYDAQVADTTKLAPGSYEVYLAQHAGDKSHRCPTSQKVTVQN